MSRSLLGTVLLPKFLESINIVGLLSLISCISPEFGICDVSMTSVSWKFSVRILNRIVSATCPFLDELLEKFSLIFDSVDSIENILLVIL